MLCEGCARPLSNDPKEMTENLLIKIIISVIWLIAAFILHRYPVGNKIFAFLGSIVAFVHICALSGGMLLKWFVGRTSVEGGVNMAGFLVGCLVGLILGIVAGSFVSRNDIAYWLVQVVAVGFIIFFPLFRL